MCKKHNNIYEKLPIWIYTNEQAKKTMLEITLISF